MTKPLQQPKKIVSISEAAQILGVSLDTIRRWDKTGLLHSDRPDGKNRYFSLNELKAFKLNQPLSISETSYELHISPTTLRRLVKKGLIQSSRNNAGERVFHKEAIKEFLAGDYYLRRNTSSNQTKKRSVKPKETLNQLDNEMADNTFIATVASTLANKTILTRMNWQLVSGGFASLIIFLLLTAIGITNIQISTVSASAQVAKTDNATLIHQPVVTPLVSKISKTKQLRDSVRWMPSPPTQSTAGALLSIGLSDDGLTYTVLPATASANQIATDSAVNTKIDAFEIDSVDSHGYHLKLPDGSLGFIPFNNANKEESKVNE